MPISLYRTSSYVKKKAHKIEAESSESPPFSAQKLCDVNSLTVDDRHAELLAIWQEIGEDQAKKLEELRKVISAALDQIYEKAMEECVRKRMALEVSIAESEKRLKERLGSNVSQAIAPRDLPLQTRLSKNISQLQSLDNERVSGYGWVGGLLVISELRKRIINLQEALDLPPCNAAATLDEVLLSTMEALQKMCPGKIPSTFAFSSVERDQKPIFRRLQRFYKTLRAIEDMWVDSFAHKGGLSFGEKRENDESLGEQESCFNKSLMTAGFKKSMSQGHKRKPSEEASNLEQLSKKIFDKLDDISRRAKCVLDMTDENDCQSTLTCEISDYSISSQPLESDIEIESKLYSQSPITPTSVLPESTQDSVIPGSFVNAYVPPLLRPPKKLTINNSQPFPFTNSHVKIGPRGKEKTCQIGKAINHVDLSICENAELQDRIQNSKHTNPASISRQPLQMIKTTISGNGSSNDNNFAKQILPPLSVVPPLSTPPPLPPPPPPPSTIIQVKHPPSPSTIVRAKHPPPPPPPPPPPSIGSIRPPPPPLIIGSITPPPLPPLLSNANKALRPRRSNTKLKRSSQIGNLYRSLKWKVERAGETSESLNSHRKMVGRSSSSSSSQGMAEALAEITRRSSYFRQIEEDTQRFAAPIMEMKHAIESFQTRNMDELLKFHRYVELHLEDLTDETQVLARFEGFPTKKLEIIRSATALYSKLSSVADQLATWKVVPPLSRHLDKVMCYFDKIKMEVETLERVKDEESKCFESHKIFFDFNILIRIKESMVDVSSDCIALALQESKTAKEAARRAECYFSAGYDDLQLRRCLQMLWKTFQLSFRVYNFAGGQDDRAEELTYALAKEMESYPQHHWNL